MSNQCSYLIGILSNSPRSIFLDLSGDGIPSHGIRLGVISESRTPFAAYVLKFCVPVKVMKLEIVSIVFVVDCYLGFQPEARFSRKVESLL